jgi:glycosyltransferase involved in cell wall biosynthesis
MYSQGLVSTQTGRDGSARAVERGTARPGSCADESVRIGLLAPPFEPIPPRGYGGTERVVAVLADELVARGHEVTLFASADSRTRARLEPTVERAVWSDGRYSDDEPFRAIAIGHAYARASSLDVMHNHLEFFAFPAARLSRVRTITTVHWRTDQPEVREAFAEFNEQPLVAVSRAQRELEPDANWVGVVHHGLPADLYRPSYARGRHLLFCGRFQPEKGLETAIEIARRVDTTLMVAARRPPAHSLDPVIRRDRAYYESIAPRLREPGVRHVGEATDEEKQQLYAEALALLFPVDWPEPFGLVMIEALACGTPVIARPRGAVGEVLEHGRTGFLCESSEEFVGAVERVGTIDRRTCRAEFERRFTAHTMAAAYEAIYERLTVPEEGQ